MPVLRLAIALLFAAGVALDAQTPNFSGFWTLDREASDITPPAFSGGRGGSSIDRLFITHAANDTLIIGAETNGLKAWSYTPGREGTIPVGRETTMRAVSRWEGGRLVAEGARGDMKIRGYGGDILAEVRRITDRPVTTIINTHTHWDHSGANTEFPDTIDFVTHENTAAHMASADCDDGAGFEGGSIKNCEAFTGAGRRYLPKVTFENRTSLFSGPDQIDLHYFGRGHTDGDTWVVFRAARAAHAGDMMARKGLPFIDADNTNGSATEFGATLRRAIDTLGGDVDTIIPGHADDPLAWDDLVDYAGFYGDLLAHAQEGAAAGRSVAETVAAYSVPDEYGDFQAPANRVESIVRLVYEGR